MYISKTRVMLKHMSKNIDEDDVKQIVIKFTNL